MLLERQPTSPEVERGPKFECRMEQAREESNPGSQFWRLIPRHADGPVEWVDRRSNPVGTIFSRELYRISYLPARAPGENRTRLFDVGNVVCDQYTTGA
jgi:hypothetical protein